MLLVDTSIWIDHFRKEDMQLSAGLLHRNVLIHPFVIGEIALGHVPRFAEVIQDLMALPVGEIASPREVLHLIAQQRLSGSGIGYVDAHLAVSTMLTSGARLWTRDRKLHAVAQRLSIAAEMA